MTDVSSDTDDASTGVVTTALIRQDEGALLVRANSSTTSEEGEIVGSHPGVLT